MDGVVGRYSSLFTLPSNIGKVILLMLLVDVGGGAIAFLPLNLSYLGFPIGLLFGLTFLSITLLSDTLIRSSLMKKDPIFNLRRCYALSLFSSMLWFTIIILGSILSVLFEKTNIWIKIYLLGFCGVLILRSVTFSTVSSVRGGATILSILLQPTLCCLPLLSMEGTIGYHLDTHLLFFIFLAVPFIILLVFIFVASVNRVGRKILGIPTLTLFRAFLLVWAEGINAPLERLLERFGQDQSVKASLLAFTGNHGPRAIIVTPNIHPGPFKNVGSSILPHMIQIALEDRFRCVTSVPHGLCGHDLDLTSQIQNKKVVESILSAVNFFIFDSKATPLIRARIKGASATCQIFGGCALFTLTVAPQTMVDLPPKLSVNILKEVEKRGLSAAIVVDAHNSIDGLFDLEEGVDFIMRAAITALERALLQKRLPFEIGASKIVPEEFSVREGLGPSGISVLVVKVGAQKTAYITIDGNNMVSGLRERILSRLREGEITDGEILTTDTHVVSGVVLTKRGYHPVGEVMDQGMLIDYIWEATTMASNNLKSAASSWRTVTIPRVKTVGEKQLRDLFHIIDEAAKLSKRLAISIFFTAGVLLTFVIILI